MKKYFILIAIFFVFHSSISAQSDTAKWTVSVQYGYMGELIEALYPGFNTWLSLPPNFTSVQSNINPASYGKIRNGSFVSFDIEKKMKKKGFSLGLSFVRGQVSYKINDEERLFWDKDAIENYEIISLFFNKEVALSKKHSLIFGFGLSNISVQQITVDESQFGSTTYVEYRNYSNSDLGFMLNLQYLYQIRKNLSFGLQIKSLHSTIFFWQAIMIAPTLRFKVY